MQAVLCVKKKQRNSRIALLSLARTLNFQAKCVLKRRKGFGIVRKIYSRVEHGKERQTSGKLTKTVLKPDRPSMQTSVESNTICGHPPLSPRKNKTTTKPHSFRPWLIAKRRIFVDDTELGNRRDQVFVRAIAFSSSIYLNKGLSLCDARHLHWQL
jgi:hypothetical protein